uniref:Uncharacterized protein n=1 Tax=Oncorhynchus tshawytscha TaxID=74940 RepID=A0A8C8K0V7_ONCTS
MATVSWPLVSGFHIPYTTYHRCAREQGTLPLSASIQEICVIFPCLVESVVGSLDGSTVGWSLSSLQANSSDYNNILEFLQLRWTRQ